MKHYQLQTINNSTILFEGTFLSFQDCLETAINQKINLDQINLSNQNLSNANLDNAIIPRADFTGANLTGANLSESYLRGAHFKNTTLYNTCLCYSNLSECSFKDSFFGATDIFGAILRKSHFSTLSCFTLNFSTARHMEECTFINPNGTISKMSQPPIVINGLINQPLIIMDNEIKAGHNTISHHKLLPLSRKLAARTLNQRIEEITTNS